MWTGKNTIQRRDVHVDDPGPREVMVKVGAVGVCGTDVAIVRGDLEVAVPPLPLGHEAAGTVVGIGSEVTSLRVGDRCAGSCDRMWHV